MGGNGLAGQTILSRHSLICILVSNLLIPQINFFGPADFDHHILDKHNISTSLANMFDFRFERTKTSAATVSCNWDINIHCFCRLAWQTDKFIFMCVVTDQIKASTFQRVKSTLSQQLCSFASVIVSRWPERARVPLWISKCQVWAVLTRAKCHGSLLTLGVESFSTYPQSLISILMP